MKPRIFISKRCNNNHGELKLIIKVRVKTNEAGYNVLSLCANTNIYVRPEDWDEEAEEVRCYPTKRVLTAEIIEAREQADRLTALLRHISEQWEAADKSTITKDWLFLVVDKYNFPEKYRAKEEVEAEERKKKNIYDHFAEYLAEKEFSSDFHKGNEVMIRSVARYEMFLRATDTPDFVFNVDTVTKEVIEDFRAYITNEKQIAEEHPRLFKKMLCSYPANVKKGRNHIADRGSNAVFKLMKKLKAFFAWLNKKGITANEPFKGVELGREQFGTPYYITMEERDKIAASAMPSKHLETQRDIFIFHCWVGCRISDLMRLTAANIVDGILTYTPHKTKDEGQQTLQARVPISDVAQELIKKYKGQDSKGRLFPFISAQKYNDAIKEIFTIAGITRNVEVRNALTGETEIRPINEIASSHLARRTFCGNLYYQVPDPNIIGKMSGHVEGSKAFARYRKIEDKTLKDAINLLKKV